MNPKLKEVRENSKGNKELSAIVGFCKTSLGMIKQEDGTCAMIVYSKEYIVHKTTK